MNMNAKFANIDTCNGSSWRRYQPTTDRRTNMLSTATISATELKLIISKLDALKGNGGRMNNRWIDPHGLELFVASHSRTCTCANSHFIAWSSLCDEGAQNPATARSAMKLVRTLAASLSSLTRISPVYDLPTLVCDRGLASSLVRLVHLVSLCTTK
jgi:hypothetical protein